MRALLLLLLLPAAASAQASTSESCAASFPARLSATRSAINRYSEWLAERGRVIPWFEQHCRLLEADELEARHLVDEFSFTCDTQRGRPRGLNERFLEQYLQPVTLVSLIETSIVRESDACREHDARDRVALSMHQEEAIRLLEVLCFEVASARCDEARATIAAARARAAERAAPARTPQ